MDDESTDIHKENSTCLHKWSSVEQAGWCRTIYDGLLCWQPTAPSTNASQPCREFIRDIQYDTSRNATRWCRLDGTWENYTDFAECVEKAALPEIMYEQSPEEIETTTVIYSVGYTLSLITLSLALFIFIYFKDLRCLRNTIHTNLMFAYVMADFLWILSLTISTHTDSSSCLILFTLLHYFILTTYFWMFVEGLYLYMLVVETFTRENIKLRAYLLIGWGSPVVVIVAWIIARSSIVEHKQNTENQCKFMTGSWADWIYNVPSIVVLVTNLLFLFRIMWVLITKLRSANNAETEQYRKGSKALLVLIPLLGVTFILLLLGPNSSIYNILRAFLLSTQGLTVGLLYCFVNTEVQNALKHRWQRWRDNRSLATRNYMKDSSPNTRTESIRLYSRHEIAPYRKRESTGSESTTMTFVGGGRPSNGGARSPFLQPPSEPV